MKAEIACVYFLCINFLILLKRGYYNILWYSFRGKVLLCYYSEFALDGNLEYLWIRKFLKAIAHIPELFSIPIGQQIFTGYLLYLG